jgi:lysozyme
MQKDGLMRILGVDVSHWEGPIDWQQARPWLGFVYMKCTDGLSYVDNTYDFNQKGCSANGIPHAPFHYYQPACDPIAQADHFVKAATKNYKVYILDLEEPPDDRPSFPGDVFAFILRVQQLTGQRPAIYTSPGYWNEFVHPKPEWSKNYDLAVAHYTVDHIPTLPIGWNDWKIWQFSDHFFFPGCSSAADGDWLAGDLAQCRNYFGNYRQVDPPIVSLRARSYFDQLHVRQQPSAKSKEVAHLAKGELVMVEEVGGKDVWIRHQEGWTAVEIDGYRYMEIVKP